MLNKMMDKLQGRVCAWLIWGTSSQLDWICSNIGDCDTACWLCFRRFMFKLLPVALYRSVSGMDVSVWKYINLVCYNFPHGYLRARLLIRCCNTINVSILVQFNPRLCQQVSTNKTHIQSESWSLWIFGGLVGSRKCTSPASGLCAIIIWKCHCINFGNKLNR